MSFLFAPYHYKNPKRLHRKAHKSHYTRAIRTNIRHRMQDAIVSCCRFQISRYQIGKHIVDFSDLQLAFFSHPVSCDISTAMQSGDSGRAS
jgi:hypothetical protein